ncbi:MAG: hypothetical protein Q7J98_05145, partial [Kiritimatiellia bacterium]|nr:hypothetical protein [Kiritimatiellia bacterium]
MKQLLNFILPIFFFTTSIFADIPPINLTVDVTDPNPPPFAFSVRAGTTPAIIVECVTNLTTGGAYINFGTGWSTEFNYFPNDAASAGVTLSGTLTPATGIITFNTVASNFPAQGLYFAEVYLH